MNLFAAVFAITIFVVISCTAFAPVPFGGHPVARWTRVATTTKVQNVRLIRSASRASISSEVLSHDLDTKKRILQHLSEEVDDFAFAYSSSRRDTGEMLLPSNNVKRICDGMERISLHVNAALREGARKEAIKTELAPLVPLFMQSPLAARMLTWPRGYAGDFETVEYIMHANNTVPLEGSPAWIVNQYILDHPSCQQHRNKIDAQARIMRNYVEKRASEGRKAEIFSLACGSCPDVQQIQHALDSKDCHFILLDQDADALSFAESKLEDKVSEKCTFVQGNILKLHRGTTLSPMTPNEGLDLVVAGGLFDYLSDKMIVRLLSYIWNSLLAEGGSVFFTNINVGFNALYNVECIFNWSLIERSASDILSLCAKAGISPALVKTETDRTGLAVMATATRPAT